MVRPVFKSRLALLISAFVVQICATAALAAPLNIKGTVTDETGEPLIGVSVQPVKSNKGVTTDIDGKYALSIPAPGEVNFSYVGMKPKIVKVSQSGTYDVVLEQGSNTLDDVVVVGYGTQRKVNLTGSVQSVNSEEILRRSVSNGSLALQGIVPGLTAVQSSGQPGGDQARITIRGRGSINSNTSPLVLIDGVEGDMNRIDLNSVESISVLKDAASASIYGSRASNGVILITTKRGAKGKPKVTFNGYIGWNKPTEMAEGVDAIGLMQAIDMARANNDQDPLYTDMIETYRTEGADQLNRYDTNWRDAIMKSSAMVQNYSVGVSGGSDFLNVYASAGFYKQDGMVPNNDFKRYNLRLNSDMKINDWIHLGVDASVRQAEVLNPIGGATTLIGYTMTFQPLLSGINADGTWGYGLQGNNPIATINDGGYSKSLAPEYVVKTTLTVNPFKGMTILGSYNWKRNTGSTYTFADTYEEYEYGALKGTFPTEVKKASDQRSNSDYKQYNAMATYENTFASHYLKAMIGFQSEEFNSNNLTAGRSDFKYDGYNELQHGDASTATNSAYSTAWSMLSYIFRINYTFRDRYLLEVNGRYDGTSRFTNDRRWGFFPSVSLGWRMSEEAFFQGLKPVLNNLKLRASFGRLGNQDLDGTTNFPYVSAVSTGNAYGYFFDEEFTPGAAQTQLANPLITWEKSSQYNVGLDWSLFNNRLSGGFDYYVRKIDDMIQRFPVPEFAALEAPWQNAGSMRNNGWELSLGWNDRIGNVNYYAKFNISDVRNKVLNLYGNEYKSGNTYTAEGLPYGNYYGYIADGFYRDQADIDNSPAFGDRNTIKPGFIKYKDISGPDGVPDGVIDGEDRAVIGNPTPHYGYGLTLGADWKGFDISVFFQGVAKRDVLYTGAGARPLLGNMTIYTHQLDTWTPDNQDATFPLLLVDNSGGLANNMASSFWVQSGAYCRLKNLVVGYTIPKKITRKATIENLRVYATAQNLFTIRGDNFYKGFDPESSAGASCYPLNKTFLFGLQLEF